MLCSTLYSSFIPPLQKHGSIACFSWINSYWVYSKTNLPTGSWRLRSGIYTVLLPGYLRHKAYFTVNVSSFFSTLVMLMTDYSWQYFANTKWHWSYSVLRLCKLIGADWITGFLTVHTSLGSIPEVYNFNCFDITHYYSTALERRYDLTVYGCVFHISLSTNRT